jgi:hypothetical protein
MTVTLDYRLDPAWGRHWEDLDLRAADEMTLRYRCFLGDVLFAINGVDFSARWGWVPVLDFALSMRTIVGGLGAVGEETFEFTESEATIDFTRTDGGVRIDADYTSTVADVQYVELSLEAERFLARVIKELMSDHPELGENAFISAVSRELTLSA